MIERAGKRARLFGGSLLVAMIDDGQEHDKPLIFDKENHVSSIYKINSLQVYERPDITFTNLDVNTDSSSPYFLQPEWCTLNLRGGFTSNARVSIRVHRSRCYVFEGEDSTTFQRQRELGFGTSTLNKCFVALTNYLESQRAAVAVQRDFIQVVFKIKDLIGDLANDDGA